ncbi:MAG TPA: hypothetical protein VN658_00860 [Candidatus Acidoferrales bacterium]|nr:hypothetical protein [Candidatus Acidoferrales bacterium]
MGRSNQKSAGCRHKTTILALQKEGKVEKQPKLALLMGRSQQLLRQILHYFSKIHLAATKFRAQSFSLTLPDQSSSTAHGATQICFTAKFEFKVMQVIIPSLLCQRLRSLAAVLVGLLQQNI